jgi:hypothetical protein
MAEGKRKAVIITVAVDPAPYPPGHRMNIYFGPGPSASPNVDYSVPINPTPIPLIDGAVILLGYPESPYASKPYVGGPHGQLFNVPYQTSDLDYGTWWMAVVAVDHCGNEAAGPHNEKSILVLSRPDPPTNLVKGSPYDDINDLMPVSWAASPTF